MAFVHSLVKVVARGKAGWRAPIELGEATPHYISFVIPLDASGQFLPRYTCETITTTKKTKRITSHELVKAGEDAFVLRRGTHEFWFTTTPGAKEERRLPYVGDLEHPDFQLLFTEIEPEEPNKLDELYNEEATFVIGCDAFTHYAGMQQLTRNLRHTEKQGA